MLSPLCVVCVFVFSCTFSLRMLAVMRLILFVVYESYRSSSITTMHLHITSRRHRNVTHAKRAARTVVFSLLLSYLLWSSSDLRIYCAYIWLLDAIMKSSFVCLNNMHEKLDSTVQAHLNKKNVMDKRKAVKELKERVRWNSSELTRKLIVANFIQCICKMRIRSAIKCHSDFVRNWSRVKRRKKRRRRRRRWVVNARVRLVSRRKIHKHTLNRKRWLYLSCTYKPNGHVVALFRWYVPSFASFSLCRPDSNSSKKKLLFICTTQARRHCSFACFYGQYIQTRSK